MFREYEKCNKNIIIKNTKLVLPFIHVPTIGYLLGCGLDISNVFDIMSR